MSLWSAAVIIGFLGWIGCGFGLIYRALTPDLRFIGAKTAFWGGFLLFFWLLWIVALTQA